MVVTVVLVWGAWGCRTRSFFEAYLPSVERAITGSMRAGGLSCKIGRRPRGYKMSDERDRSIEAKIARLRARLKDAPMDASVRMILLGLLDLLGDEL